MTSGNISVTSGRTATITSQLIGSSGISKLGAGTLVLTNAANNWTGGVDIQEGTVQISSMA